MYLCLQLVTSHEIDIIHVMVNMIEVISVIVVMMMMIRRMMMIIARRKRMQREAIELSSHRFEIDVLLEICRRFVLVLIALVVKSRGQQSRTQSRVAVYRHQIDRVQVRASFVLSLQAADEAWLDQVPAFEYAACTNDRKTIVVQYKSLRFLLKYILIIDF